MHARKNKWLGFYSSGEAGKGSHGREGVANILKVKGGWCSGVARREIFQKEVSMNGPTKRRN